MPTFSIEGSGNQSRTQKPMCSTSTSCFGEISIMSVFKANKITYLHDNDANMTEHHSKIYSFDPICTRLIDKRDFVSEKLTRHNGPYIWSVVTTMNIYVGWNTKVESRAVRKTDIQHSRCNISYIHTKLVEFVVNYFNGQE